MQQTFTCLRSILVFLYLGILLPLSALQAQTSLSPGDIVIVGYNADAPEDEFSFVLLTDITAGTQINFTDFGWCSGIDINGWQSPNPCGASTGAVSDGIIRWTATTALTCGTQVVVQCSSALGANTGTVTGVQGTFNNPSVYMQLAAGGDQVFGYQGTHGSPTLICGFNMNGNWDASLSQCTFTSTQSVRPPALSAANSLDIAPEVDNAIYNCSVTSGSASAIRTAALTLGNWTTDNTTPFSLPIGCSFVCGPLSLDTRIQNFLGRFEPGKGNILSWSDDFSGERDRYEVFRSQANGESEALGYVPAGGQINYVFTDASPLPGRNLYELYVLDSDGQRRYAGMVELFTEMDNESVRIYPNPSRDIFGIDIVAGTSRKVELAVFDLTGRKLHSEWIELPEGETHRVIDLSDAAPGVYTVRVGKQSFKVVRI